MTQNNTTFVSQFNPMDTPETLFQRIKECQEVAVLGGAPYSAAQIVWGPQCSCSFNLVYSR
jgi:hypothetical protein